MTSGVFSDGWHAYGPERQPFDWQTHFDLAHQERTGWRLLGPAPPDGYTLIPDPTDFASALSDFRSADGGPESSGPRSRSLNETFRSPN